MEEEILRMLAKQYALLELHSIKIAETMKGIKDEILAEKNINKWTELVEKFKVELKNQNITGI